MVVKFWISVNTNCDKKKKGTLLQLEKILYIHVSAQPSVAKGIEVGPWLCLMDHVTDLPLGSYEVKRPPEMTKCESRPCQNWLEWYTGPWSLEFSCAR